MEWSSRRFSATLLETEGGNRGGGLERPSVTLATLPGSAAMAAPRVIPDEHDSDGFLLALPNLIGRLACICLAGVIDACQPTNWQSILVRLTDAERILPVSVLAGGVRP